MHKDSKIYIAGHRGLVGSAILEELQKQGYTNLIYKTHQELDLINQKAVEEFFEQEKPEYVILSAAKAGGIVANSQFRADFYLSKSYDRVQCNSSSLFEWCKKIAFYRLYNSVSKKCYFAHK